MSSISIKHHEINDLQRTLNEALRVAQEVSTSINVLNNSILGATLVRTYRVYGRLQTGEYRDDNYAQEIMVVSPNTLRDGLIELVTQSESYCNLNCEEATRKAKYDLNQQLGSKWTTQKFFDSNIEIWPYNDRAIIWNGATLISVHHAPPNLITREKEKGAKR